MPPFLPQKRHAEDQPANSTPPSKKKIRPAQAPPVNNKVAPNVKEVRRPTLEDSDSSSTLSDVDSDDFEDVKPRIEHGGSDGEDHSEVDWEDAMDEVTPGEPRKERTIGDLQINLSKDDDTGQDFSTSVTKKGPSKRERQVRVQAHCMHVQYLLYHNAIRNRWICDRRTQEILVKQLPEQIKKEVERWRIASGLEPTDSPKKTSKQKQKGKRKSEDPRSARDWGKPSERLEKGRADMSHGDPLISLMKVLSAYWKRKFVITAPGLRKKGYSTKLALKREIASFRQDEHDPLKHGERIQDLQEFRQLAQTCQGSRDVGAQLFTALLRGLRIESRLVANLQPCGFGFTKSEEAVPSAVAAATSVPIAKEYADGTNGSAKEAKFTKRKRAKVKLKKGKTKSRGKATDPIDLGSDEDTEMDSAEEGDESRDDDSIVDVTPSIDQRRVPRYDKDLAYPIYWTEAISPITSKVLPVSPLVINNPVTVSPQFLLQFEPRGAKADKAKQVMAYVVAYSADGTAKDVIVRYLKNQMWPGRTKGMRLPIEKVPIYNKRGKIKRYEEFDWFKSAMSGYTRMDKLRTAVDDVEDSTDLVPKVPEKKKPEEEGDTLQNLKTSADWCLERLLRREEALRPEAKPDRMFLSGKGDKVQEEPVYRRSDVERCLSAESWHKEGRRPLVGAVPLKYVPIRAVTLTRKREIEEHEQRTGEKPQQGLYSWDQTEYIIPAPIKDGIIPKNAYGNMDCFVPSMVPKGAVHIAKKSTVRICKKLEVDFAEAVVGFEFGNKRAVPVIHGVVVAKENETKVLEAWEVWAEEQRVKEEGKLERQVLDLWRKMLMGLRINEKVFEDYGDPTQQQDIGHSAMPNRKRKQTEASPEAGGFMAEDEYNDDDGGGFLLPHEEEPVGRIGTHIEDDRTAAIQGLSILPDAIIGTLSTKRHYEVTDIVA